jgi:hypothetical protein
LAPLLPVDEFDDLLALPMLANKFIDHLAMLMSVTQTFDDHLAPLLPVDEFDDHLALPAMLADKLNDHLALLQSVTVTS